ncbi:MAG: VPLPA-CTERM-specific exosortase XrtD, partial [Thermodesulfobacteriota bacterium]|nr:VPLPA-CTERM-specific exosortase XrtD [Thermodesulfobacteriota bacterium]
VGLCWLHLGWEKIKELSFPFIIMLTMFPLPNFLYNKVSLNLKLISSQLGVDMMQLYGMSAYREGNVIDLGFTQLQVVDACSGLRFLIPLIVLGILLAYFFRAHFWKRAVLVISTMPLAVVTNSLRIALTGILYEVWGAKVAEGFFHGFSGWFIFMFSLAVLLLEMWILKKLPPAEVKGRTGGDQDRPGQKRPLVLGVSAQRSDNKGLLAVLRPPQFIVALILLGVTLILSQGVEFREKIPITRPLDQFPLKIGEWTGTSQAMEQKFIDTLDLSDYVIIDYKNKLGRQVNFYAAYYESQRKGESIHSPATCLPGGGWRFNQAGAVTISTPGHGKGSMKVNRAYMQKGEYRQLSYYWFDQRGRVLTNAYQLKIFVFLDALTKQRTDGALVRLITPVYENEKLKDAEERLQAFTRQSVPVLAEFIPGSELD